MCEFDLIGRQVDRGPVETFRLLVLVEPEEQHDIRRRSRGCHSVGDQLAALVRVVVVGGVAGRVDHLRTGMALDLVERDVDFGGVDLRRTAALIAGFGGQCADDGQ